MLELLLDPATLWTLVFFAALFIIDFIRDHHQSKSQNDEEIPVIDNAILIQALREQRLRETDAQHILNKHKNLSEQIRQELG